ncbi:hypothetical protein QR685DRAFT_569156 [Neurospora intermedia]|uniref:Uncharacterized protein n=1 Tax=Neurospora intermedia TaxID=5142 RepID=A0ABR3DKZ6_NEUIN
MRSHGEGQTTPVEQTCAKGSWPVCLSERGSNPEWFNQSSILPLSNIITNFQQQHLVMKRSTSSASAPSALNISTTGPVTSPITSPMSLDNYHEMRYSFESETTVAPVNSRKDSGNITNSADPSRPLRATKSHNKHVNAHSYCGRHSTEFLFGGRSIRNLLSNLKHRRDSRE